MKNLLIIILLCLFVQLSAQVPVTAGREKQLSGQVEPPQVVKDKFMEEYPEVTPSWKMDGKNFRAEFIDPVSLKGAVIVYDKDGHVIRRESEVDNSSYPQSINDYYIKKFPGEKYSTWSSRDQSGTVTYFIRRAGEVIWFDRNGNPVQASAGKKSTK